MEEQNIENDSSTIKRFRSFGLPKKEHRDRLSKSKPTQQNTSAASMPLKKDSKSKKKINELTAALIQKETENAMLELYLKVQVAKMDLDVLKMEAEKLGVEIPEILQKD